MIPELPELNSGFASCYPKFPNKIRVSGISGSGLDILGSGFGLRVFCPVLLVSQVYALTATLSTGHVDKCRRDRISWKEAYESRRKRPVWAYE
jgi:hypothetical protein